MREILFRGRRANGEWVEGELQNKPVGICEGIGEVYDVDHDSVGQFIGLNDTNGVKIFEGDIVRVETFGVSGRGYAFIGKVTFDSASFCVETHEAWLFAWQDYEVTVLGNVFDDPQLMENDEDGPTPNKLG